MIVGWASGTVTFVKFVAIHEWFHHKLAKASALCFISAGAGGMALSAFLPASFNYYGYTGTLLLLAGLTLHCLITVVVARLPDRGDFDRATDQHSMNAFHQTEDNGFIKDCAATPGTITANTNDVEIATIENGGRLKNEMAMYQETNKEIDTNFKQVSSSHSECHQYFNYHLLKDARVVSLSILMWGAAFCEAIMETHSAGFGKERGLTTAQISHLMLLAAALNIPAGLLAGVVFDFQYVRPIRPYIYSVWYLLVGLVLFWLPNAQGTLSVSASWMACSILHNTFFFMSTTVLAEVVSKTDYGSALGMQRFFRGLAMIPGSTLGGELVLLHGLCVYEVYITF